MPATYDAIASTSLSSFSFQITFSSISQSYTDLRLVLTGEASGAMPVQLRINGNTNAGYSLTRLSGDGSSSSSGRTTSATSWDWTLSNSMGDANLPNLFTADFNSYSGSSAKSVLLTHQYQSEGSSGRVSYGVGTYSTNTNAITSIDIIAVGGDAFNSGTVATLYGILRA